MAENWDRRPERHGDVQRTSAMHRATPFELDASEPTSPRSSGQGRRPYDLPLRTGEHRNSQDASAGFYAPAVAVPRRKPTPRDSIGAAARYSQTNTSPVNITYSSEDFSPRSSSAQFVSELPASPASPMSASSSPGPDPPPHHHHRGHRNSATAAARSSLSMMRRPDSMDAADGTRAGYQSYINYGDARAATSPVLAPRDQNQPQSRHASTGSIDSNLRASAYPPPPPPHQLQPGMSASVPALPTLHHRGSGEEYQSARSESPASAAVSVGEAPLSARQHLTPAAPANGRPSLTMPPTPAFPPSHVRDPSRGRTQSPISAYGSPMLAPRPSSLHSLGRAPDTRPASYIDLLNIPYPQPAPTASFDNSHLRTAVGTNASLLSHRQTLEMYRANAKKTNDTSILYNFAVFLVQTAQDSRFATPDDETATPSTLTKQPQPPPPQPRRDSRDSPALDAPLATRSELLREARQILQRLSDRSPFAQYYLADGYASGVFNKGKEDYDRAFPLFLSASKHGHAEAGYRAGICYEYGWGCRRDPVKAVQFYRASASKSHPGAATRLGLAYRYGDLGTGKREREAVKWLKRGVEAADVQHNAAPYELGLLHETGYGEDVFRDESYAAQLFTKAADLGHAQAAFRLGRAYENGELNCPRDAGLSVHFYNIAATRDHEEAMMSLCAWYLVGAPPTMDKDENEAYEWAKKAADLGMAKAEYAVGYFTEMGIGCRRDPLEANVWYVRAADQGDERAKHRLEVIRAAASGTPVPPTSLDAKRKGKDGKDDKNCIVM